MKTTKMKCEALTKIQDNNVYVFNPIWRMRNEKDHVLAATLTDDHPRIHRAVAVVLALCNGQRTVRDIAQLTQPLCETTAGNSGGTMQVSLRKVKEIICLACCTPEMEQTQREPQHLLRTKMLLSTNQYERFFKRFRKVEYCARDFLPKNPSELGNGPFNMQRESTPVSIKWHVTSACTTDCKYCFVDRREKRQLLSKEKALSVIKEAEALNVLDLCLAGGDVLCYPYLQEILEAIGKSNKFVPLMLSTKTFLSKEKAAMLANLPNVFDLQFSMDSTVDEVAEELVGVKGFCERIFKSIDNALEARLPIKVQAVVTAKNVHTIPSWYCELKRRGVKTLGLALYRRTGFNHSDDLFIQEGQYARLKKEVERLQEEYGEEIPIRGRNPHWSPYSMEETELYWLKARPVCGAGRAGIVLLADGKVIPCEQLPQTNELFCGDVTKQSIQEIWDGQRLAELTHAMPLEKFKGTTCFTCAERSMCHARGICIRELALYHNTIYQPDMWCPKSTLPYVRVT